MAPVIGVTTAVAVPSLPPGQETGVVVELNVAGLSVMVTVPLAVQPFPLTTDTV